jgi:putative two-component system response regulator
MATIIICDNAAELAIFTDLASGAGIEDVIGFEHPANALDWCAGNVPDLVYVDFLMRATDGMEVIHRLRSMPAMRDVPIVLMLPHGFESVSARAWRFGATDFLAKPADPTEFRARSRNLLALRAALKKTQGGHAAPAVRGPEYALPDLHVH